MKKHFIFILFALALIGAALMTAAQEGIHPGDKGKNKPKQSEIPPDASGLNITLSAKGGGTVVASFKNSTGKKIVIKNEFMSVPQANTSFVRVFMDDKELAPSGIYSKKMLVRSGDAVVALKPNESKNLFEIQFTNLPAGQTHYVYVAYSSQIFNYEKGKHNWWLGTTRSNKVKITVTHAAGVDSKIAVTGKNIMKNILSDLYNASSKYPELKGIGGGHIHGGKKGGYSAIPQIIFNGPKGLSLNIFVAGVNDSVSPMPEFDQKFPFLSIKVVCQYKGGKDARARNAVFDIIRDRAAEFNTLTRAMADQKNMQISEISQNTENLIAQADLIAQAQITSAKPEMENEVDQIWIVSAAPRKILKGKSKAGSLVIYTDSPTVRFNGQFINKQFIVFLDLKFQSPESYNLLGAAAVSNELIELINKEVKAKKN